MADLIDRQAAIKVILDDKIGEKSLVIMRALGSENEAKSLNMACDRHVKFIKELPSAQPEQRWIPLGRPMNSGTYLVTLRQKFEGEETYRVRIMRLNNGRWVLPKHFPEWINEEMEQEVLAWMPLPKPYREDGEVDG